MDDFPPIPADGRILFFQRDRADFGFLSHFHPSPMVLDGEVWPTAEHWYQTQKSFDLDYRAAIRACATPGQAKRLASFPIAPRKDRGSWFLAHGAVPRPDWGEVKGDLMRRVDRAKYTQNPGLAARLLATGDAPIIEDSPHDAYWGVGRDGLGENWAGRIIMEVRESLRARAADRRPLVWAGAAFCLSGALLAAAIILHRRDSRRLA
jgi:ribA/ribD-fused uncharacterized protein